VQILGVSAHLVTTIQGMILFFVIAGEVFARNRIIVTFPGRRGAGASR